MSLIELLAKIDELKESFEKVEQEIKKKQLKQISCLEKIFISLKPIMRFIDQPIFVEMNKYNSSYGVRQKIEQHTEKGLKLLGGMEQDYTGDYPHEDSYWKYSGEAYYLTRSLSIILVKYDGSGSSWQGSNSSWHTEITELTLKKMLIENNEAVFFYEIIANIKEHIHAAVKENENKFNIVQKQLETINQINELLDRDMKR